MSDVRTAMDSRTAPAAARPPRPAMLATSRGLLSAGSAVLVATVGVLVLAVTRHLSGVHGPVLPVSWCRRASSDLTLPPLSGTRWLTSWQQDWVAVIFAAGMAALYLGGLAAVYRQGRRWSPWRTAAFLAGLGVCVLATTSAVGVYDMAMFSAHMLGHLALVMLAPSLLAAGKPMTLALHATRSPWHGRILRFVHGRVMSLWFCPPVALATYTVVIVGTHLTGLMSLIMAHPWAGQLEHLAYLVVGYQFFALVIGDEPIRWRLSMPAKQMLLAVAMAVDTFTGVILLQSSQAISMTGMSPARFDPLADTHLGGAIMWVGGDGIMAAVMITVAATWLRRPEYRRRNSRSWLEQARRSVLASHVASTARESSGAGGTINHDVDSDDQALADYNQWLQRLSAHDRV